MQGGSVLGARVARYLNLSCSLGEHQVERIAERVCLRQELGDVFAGAVSARFCCVGGSY